MLIGINSKHKFYPFFKRNLNIEFKFLFKFLYRVNQIFKEFDPGSG